MRISDWSSDVCSSDLLEPDRLRLPHQPVDLLQVLGDRLELREIDPAQVLGLVDQHCRFVLERLDLVVDLLERARGGEQILAVVDRKSVVSGKSVSVRVDLGGRRNIK